MVKSSLRRIVLLITGIHTVLYITIGDFMLEREVRANFVAFNKRRWSSEYNLNVNEKFFFGSCGDEFFRDRYSLERLVVKATPEPKPEFDPDYYRWVMTIDINKSIGELYGEQTTDSADVTCVIFLACRKTSVPLSYCRLDQFESWSAHTDFHAMHYTGQSRKNDIHYVWILFKWFRVYQSWEDV